jgi:hypothetical protein
LHQTLFPMQNGTVLDLFEPDSELVPAYGLNDGIVFGFRVETSKPRPQNCKRQAVNSCATFSGSPK